MVLRADEIYNVPGIWNFKMEESLFHLLDP